MVVRDRPGFFTTRVFAACLDEALARLGEAVAPAAGGGELGWVQAQGLPRFVTQAQQLAAAHGGRFQPSAWLCVRAGLHAGVGP